MHVRVMAVVLVPLLALGPSCAAPRREVRLELEGGETVVTNGQLLLSNGSKVAARVPKVGS